MGARIWPHCVRNGCTSPQQGLLPFCSTHWGLAKILCREEVNDFLLTPDDSPKELLATRIEAIRVHLETP